MRCINWVPAAGVVGTALLLGLVSTVYPAGPAMLLVRLPSGPGIELLEAAATADAVLVAVPRPGFAVLYGDAARVRSQFGWTVLWPGEKPCS